MLIIFSRKHNKFEEFNKTIKSQATDIFVEGLETMSS